MRGEDWEKLYWEFSPNLGPSWGKNLTLSSKSTDYTLTLVTKEETTITTYLLWDPALTLPPELGPPKNVQTLNPSPERV